VLSFVLVPLVIMALVAIGRSLDRRVQESRSS